MTELAAYCGFCGTKIEPTSKFCSHCGKPISLAAAPTAGSGTSSSNSGRVRKTRSKKKIAGIVILVILGIFGALIAIGLSLSSTTTTRTPTAVVNQTQQTEEGIMRLLGNDPERINDPQWRQVAMDVLRTENMDNALLVIHSTTSWSAIVQDSDFVQRSVDGSGSRSIEFECGGFGIYSLNVQKQTEGGSLNAFVAQNGHIIKQASTGAAYGIVSITGNCE